MYPAEGVYVSWVYVVGGVSQTTYTNIEPECKTGCKRPYDIRHDRTPSWQPPGHARPSEHISVLLTARAHLLAWPRVKADARALELRLLDELVARAAVLLPLLERELEGDLELAWEMAMGDGDGRWRWEMAMGDGDERPS